MTHPGFPPSGGDSPIREAEDLSAAEHRVNIESAFPVLAAKVGSFQSALKFMENALSANPGVPTDLRSASYALHDADNALTQDVLCEVTATAGWLADALDREAGIPVVEKRQSIELYQAEDGSWCGRYVRPNGTLSFDEPLPMFTKEATPAFVLAAMTATHVNGCGYAAVRLASASADEAVAR